ncbi:MAG TPA: hypothetical protein VF556_03625 [Pyrinomonadaceae bacterium]|jgi:hypothetical protein
MKKSTQYLVVLVCLTTLNLFFIQSASIRAQGSNILATLNFDPKVDGYGFENYVNKDRNFQNDLTADDMIRLFGAKAVCISGDNAQNCVLKAAADEWRKKQIEGMNGGHCEGMASTILRMKYGRPFKTRDGTAQSFQPTATRPFDLKLDEGLGNYIAYYFITQTFDEVATPTQATGARGPVAVVNLLIDAMKTGSEIYTLGFYKYDRTSGKKSDGHAITPTAVEDIGNAFRIHVYDNNYPGETRYVVVEKEGKQTWKYVTSTNPNEPAAEYAGDIDTKTLELTPNSSREKSCYEAPFAGANAEKQCIISAASFAKATTLDFYESPAAKSRIKLRFGDRAEFFLDNDGDMLVMTPDGKRQGYDPVTNKFYEEIPRAASNLILGGRGKNLPDYRIPFNANGEPYTVTFSGKNLKEESMTDFTYSAPGFTVGFEDILLDPVETLTTTISPDGETITFTSSADGETPGIYFTFDTLDDSGASYIARIDGAQIEAGKTLTAQFDFDNLKLFFKDNDGNQDEYDIELVRINQDGSRQNLSKKINQGGGDNFELNVHDWDGGNSLCVKQDEDNDGFGDEECNP